MRNTAWGLDWEIINSRGVQYSKERDLYWFEGRLYDHLSASHNGLIGMGAQLHQIISQTNQ